jgi:endonuclease-3
MLTYHADRPYEFLFAVMMSAQTTDKQVNVVTDRLFQKYTQLHDYVDTPLITLEHDISSIGLYRTKAKHIQTTARLLITHYGGSVPRTISELIMLPGVGRKTANVVLGHLYGITSGIAVDTHVKRLTQKYHLTRETSPECIERDLMDIIPKDEWIGFTDRIIWYGRDYCPARCKKCPMCPLWKIAKAFV